MPSLNTQYVTFRAPNCHTLIPGSWGRKILELSGTWSREHWGTFDMVPSSNHMNLWYSRPRNQNTAHNTVSLPAGSCWGCFPLNVSFGLPLIQMCVQRLPPVCIWRLNLILTPCLLVIARCQHVGRGSPPHPSLCGSVMERQPYSDTCNVSS